VKNHYLDQIIAIVEYETPTLATRTAPETESPNRFHSSITSCGKAIIGSEMRRPELPGLSLLERLGLLLE
jgi:hypothetical protein